MIRTFIILFILVSTFLPFSNIFANEQNRLNTIKKEISSLKNKYNNELKKEKGEVEKLNLLKKNISENKKLINQLEFEAKELSQKIINIESEIKKLNKKILEKSKDKEITLEEIDKLKSNLAKRSDRLYRSRKSKSIVKLFTPQYLINYIKKIKYFRKIAEFDRKNIEDYKSLISELDILTAELESAKNLLFTEKNKLSKAKEEKELALNLQKQGLTELKSKEGEKKKLLSKISTNKNLYKKLIKEKETAAKELEELIAKLEREKEQREKERKARMAAKKYKKIYIPENIKNKVWNNITFSKAKKKLNWPVDGKVIKSFGNITNRLTNTTIFNPGVEIKSSTNSPVYAVNSGEVVKVFWLRGYGTTMIIDHGSGYYTVYANLDRVLRNEDEKVKAGDVLALLSDSNEDSYLHFEIWHKREKLNPVSWLK